MTARTCAFCGGGPLTLEHAWPRWLQHELLAPGSVVSMRWGPAQGLTHVDRKGLEIKVKRACLACNTDWMSRPVDRPAQDGGERGGKTDEARNSGVYYLTVLVPAGARHAAVAR